MISELCTPQNIQVSVSVVLKDSKLYSTDYSKPKSAVKLLNDIVYWEGVLKVAMFTAHFLN